MLSVKLLGTPRISWRGRTLTPATRKGMLLVCYLAARSEPVTRHELALILWPDSDGRRANLRWELHSLRRLAGASDWLQLQEDEVSVLARTDLEQLKQAVGDGDTTLALGLLSEPLLRDLDENLPAGLSEWLEEERLRMGALRRQVLKDRIAELRRLVRFSEARELATELLRGDSLDEADWRLAIELALQQGDLAAARDLYSDCRRMLARDLDLTPSAQTLALADEIEQAAAAAVAGGTQLPAALLRPPALVGRANELAELNKAWDLQQIIFISGLAGVGKTRLAQDLLRARAGDDVAVLRGQPSDRQRPYSSYTRGWRGVYRNKPGLAGQLPGWVRQEISRIMPEMLLPGEPGPPEAAAPVRFENAIVEIFRQLLDEHAAAFVDDIQYFDHESWLVGGAALVELMNDPHSIRGRMVITFRTAEMPGEFMAGLDDMVARGHACHVRLGPLAETELASLLDSLGSTWDDPQRMQRLTGGNPFFTLELLRRLHGDEAASLYRPAAELLPASVEQLLLARLRQLPQPALQLAHALAFLGETATERRLSILTGQDPAGIQELLALLEQQEIVSGLRFAHELLRATVERTIPAASMQRFSSWSASTA